MTDEYITAEKSDVVLALEAILKEIREQHELDRINNTVLARRLAKGTGAPDEQE